MLSFLRTWMRVRALGLKVDQLEERFVGVLADRWNRRYPAGIRRVCLVSSGRAFVVAPHEAREQAQALALDLGADVAIAEVVDIVPAHGLAREAS